MERDDSPPALIIIDVQKAIDHPSWGRRNNPDAEQNMARLLAAWRERKMPVVHIKHLSKEPGSTYRPGQEGCDFKPEVMPLADERVVTKSVNSAFIGTDLEQILHDLGITSLVIAGVTTNHCVESTVRMAGNLDFRTVIVSDATAAFDRADYDGKWRTAEEVHAMSLANLNHEFATIRKTDEILTNLDG